MSKPTIDTSPYVSVYRPMGGWKPIIYHYNQDDCDMPFWEPWSTYPFPFRTREEAVVAAKAWAEDEGLRTCLSLDEQQ